MKLTNPTDDELNAAFAEKVAGWRWARAGSTGLWFLRAPDANTEDWHFSEPSSDSVCRYSGIDKFTRSADAVLAWLERREWIARKCANGIHMTVGPSACFEGDTFPRAAVIALLRAHGVEVEFTG